MVKIPENVLKSVVYLYEEEGAAEHGLEFGGTGFLVALRSAKYRGWIAHYVVTNWHVAVRDKIQVVRANRVTGEPFIVKLEDWIYDPRFDLAVASFPAEPDLDCTFIHTDFFVNQVDIAARELGPGEDVFMVGRFVDHDGGRKNRPAVRFGNISVMPTPLEQPTGTIADSYCIDMHSRPGYSGSPVFVFRTPGYDPTAKKASPLGMDGGFIGFLGVHYDQFPEPWPIVGKFGEMPQVKHDGPIIRGLSGMTKVLPAWSLLELLNSPRVQEGFARAVEEYEKEMAMSGTGETASRPKVEKEITEPAADNPSHKEDFTRLLNAASKATKPAS